MHTADTAYESLSLLWNNYLALSEQVDLESMSPETLAVHVTNRTPVRPLRIAAWLARQGFFISAWSLWEYYSRSVCEGLTHKNKAHTSIVDCIARSLSANSLSFTDRAWFDSARHVRNLIAHCGGRVYGDKCSHSLQRSREAFPTIDTWQDGYLALEHEHVATLKCKIEEFISEMDRQTRRPELADPAAS
jgi:hypothetical protein